MNDNDFNKGRTGSAYLFPTRPEDPPSAPGSATSAAAAESIKPCLPKMRKLVLECFAAGGEFTREQVANNQHMRLQTVCGRVSELLGYGFLEKTGRITTVTDSGRPAEILRITVTGSAMLLQSGV